MNEPKIWSRDEMQVLFEGRTKLPLMPYNLIGDVLGRHPDAVRDKWRRTDWLKIGFDSKESNKTRYAFKSEFTQQRVDAMDKRHDVFQLRSDMIADAFERSVEALPKIPKTVYKPSRNKRLAASEDVGLLLSDLHVGHQHTLEETGGISEYNVGIFKQRMHNLQGAMTDICELHSKLYRLSKLHIFCVGDIVAGMNAAGAWSPLFITSPIVDQTTDGFDAISDAIYYWLGMFDEIVFYGIVGNHGRTAPLGIQKDHDNWDYVCYKFLQYRFADNPRVKFEIPKTWWMMKNIRGHNFLMVHGDYTRGGQIPLKNLATFEQKMSSIVKKNADYTLAGHFHSAAELTTNSGRILINGSFMGSDVYSLRNIHALSKPEQKIFGIHNRHGITWTYNINLDIPRGGK